MWKNDFNPFDKLNKVTFIPVLFQVFNVYRYNEKDIGFWTKDAIFSYPYALINAYHHRNEMRKSLPDKLLPNSVIFADSGGLQSITLGDKKQTDIVELTKWQEKHSNIGFCFDVIPFKTDTRKLTGWEFDAENFVSCAQKTLENINTALSVRSNTNFKLYGIIQGRNYKEYGDWYNIISSSKVDGFCMKSPTNNPMNVAESLLFAYHHFDKPLHLLGMSNLSKTIIIYYFSQYYKNKITFDSSTYNIGNRFHTYIHPNAPSVKIRYVKDDVEKDDSLMIFEKIYNLTFCGCPACSLVDSKEFSKWHIENDPRMGPLITLHNFITLQRMFIFLEQICHSKLALTQLVKALFTEGMIRRILATFDFIDEGVEKGFDLVSEKYKSLLLEDVSVQKQTSIFSF